MVAATPPWYPRVWDVVAAVVYLSGVLLFGAGLVVIVVLGEDHLWANPTLLICLTECSLMP